MSTPQRCKPSRAPSQTAALHAVILAAGCGRRLGAGAPKCLLPFGGRTVIERQARALSAAGVRSVTVVVGYLQELVRAECERVAATLGVEFDFVDNPDFANSNTAFSLYLARRTAMRDGVFCLNGDVLLAPDLVAALQASPAPNALLVEVKPCGAEEMKVVAAGMRIVQIGKRLPPAACLGEFIGIARFSKAAALACAAALERLILEEGRRHDFFEVALDRIAPEVELTAVTTGGRPVIEIDSPEDLARAESVVLPGIDMPSERLAERDEPSSSARRSGDRTRARRHQS